MGVVNAMSGFNTSPCLYHESLPITCVDVYTMSPEVWIHKYKNTNNINIISRNTKIPITEIHKYKLQQYQNTNYRNTEKTKYKLQKYKLQKYRQNNYRYTYHRYIVIWITACQKYKQHDTQNTNLKKIFIGDIWNNGELLNYGWTFELWEPFWLLVTFWIIGELLLAAQAWLKFIKGADLEI